MFCFYFIDKLLKVTKKYVLYAIAGKDFLPKYFTKIPNNLPQEGRRGGYSGVERLKG